MQSAIKASVVAVVATSASAFELKNFFTGSKPATASTTYPIGGEVKAATDRMAAEFQGIHKVFPTGYPTATFEKELRSGADRLSGEFSGLRTMAVHPTGYPTQTGSKGLFGELQNLIPTGYTGEQYPTAYPQTTYGTYPTGYPAHTDILSQAASRMEGEFKGLRNVIPTGTYGTYPTGAPASTYGNSAYPTGYPKVDLLGNFRDVVGAHVPQYTEGTYPTGYPTYNHEIPTRTIQVGVPVFQAPESVTVPRLTVTESMNTVQFPTATVPHFNLGVGHETFNLPTHGSY
jgi:hypothetical protein